MSKGLVYYTCNSHSEDIEIACRNQLDRARGDLELVSVSLKPINFGDFSITLMGTRSPETMHKQVLTGLMQIGTDFVFLVESDVLYHKSHFEFAPPRADTFYYNTNCWKVSYTSGHAVWTDDLHQVSGICASRDLLLEFYAKRVRQIEQDGFNRHYEPGHRQTVGGMKVKSWMSEFPNVDIRHKGTITRSKWSPDEFRNPIYAKGWKESSSVDGWGVTEGRMKEFLRGVS